MRDLSSPALKSNTSNVKVSKINYAQEVSQNQKYRNRNPIPASTSCYIVAHAKNKERSNFWGFRILCYGTFRQKKCDHASLIMG